MTVSERISWLGLDTADEESGLLLFAAADQGLSGLDLPQFETTLTRGARNGAIGGAQWTGAAVLQQRLIALTNDALLNLRQAMKPRPRPDDEQPLTFEGFAFPDEHRLYVRPSLCQFRLTASATLGQVYVVDCAWTSTDGLVYSEEQAVETFGTVTPVTSATFEVANDGLDVGQAGRAIEVRITAQTTLTSPSVRFDHEDDTFELVTFSGLTMTAGQVLTVRDDLLPRVGSQIVSGYVRTSTDVASGSRHGRLWQLPPGASDVTVTAASGTFSGFVKTRSVW
ncbi:MAG: hypothetical protein EKK62_07670 [Acidimicrobiia bacterium]|nr:MAG: hypothetical protein EKK62_07670 [Acidimicrobiia bacterium]